MSYLLRKKMKFYLLSEILYLYGIINDEQWDFKIGEDYFSRYVEVGN